MKMVALGELVEIKGGGTPSKDVPEYWDGEIPWASVKDFKDFSLGTTVDRISASGVSNSATQIIPAGNIIVPTRMAVGKAAVNLIDMAINQDLKAIIPGPKVTVRYLLHALLANSKLLEDQATGATVKGIKLDALRSLRIPLPPLEEQKRIAAILDQADALRRLRARALDRLNALGQAIFHEMFGDPRTNLLGWQTMEIGRAVARISDGPFGSNLKSSHYVQNGVRVIRLQNIGVGEFIDRDKAFISEDHFKVLKKHECLPGDVLVGTLGDPNLRACIQPDWINRALNKADCVQLRPDQKTANAHYLAQLLNEPSVLEMASDKILGQTRARISMGRLRSVCVPIPPIALQNEFADRMHKVKDQTDLFVERAKAAEALFTSLQYRAFRGEL